MVYSVQIISNLPKDKHIKDAWNALVDEQRCHHPYLDYEWFKLWLNHFENYEELLVSVISVGDCVKAIFPFMKKREKLKGVKVIKIELIGNVYSSVRNFIFSDIDDNEKAEILQVFCKTLMENKQWDLIDLQSLPEEDFCFKPLKSAIKKCRLDLHEYFCFGNWYLDGIDFTGEEYIESRTSNIKNNIKRYSRKLHSMGLLEHKIVTMGDGKTIDKYMDAYYQVYANSWKEPEIDPKFHRDLALLACKKGWLRLGLLFLDKTPIAAQLWLVCKGVAYIVKLAYDEKYRKMIPGVILSSRMMKYVIDIDNVKEVDYLMGDEPYKKDWTPKRRERKGIMLFNRNIKGRLLAFLIMSVHPVFKRNVFFIKIWRIIFSEH